MKGLLMDINIQGFLPDLRAALNAHELATLLSELRLSLYTFRDFNLPRDLDDRQLWHFCQRERVALLTDNRNRDGEDSLQATMNDSLTVASLPVLTPGNKGRLLHDRAYQARVATSIVEVHFGVAVEGKYLGTGRLFLPLAEDA